MLESFIKSKRNMFSRVSGIVIDAHKDDKINDFVRELDETGVWLAGRREVCSMFYCFYDSSIRQFLSMCQFFQFVQMVDN
jgi:hypothetical protein